MQEQLAKTFVLLFLSPVLFNFVCHFGQDFIEKVQKVGDSNVLLKEYKSVFILAFDLGLDASR